MPENKKAELNEEWVFFPYCFSIVFIVLGVVNLGPTGFFPALLPLIYFFLVISRSYLRKINQIIGLVVFVISFLFYLTKSSNPNFVLQNQTKTLKARKDICLIIETNDEKKFNLLRTYDENCSAVFESDKNTEYRKIPAGTNFKINEIILDNSEFLETVALKIYSKEYKVDYRIYSNDDELFAFEDNASVNYLSFISIPFYSLTKILYLWFIYIPLFAFLIYRIRKPGKDSKLPE